MDDTDKKRFKTESSYLEGPGWCVTDTLKMLQSVKDSEGAAAAAGI